MSIQHALDGELPIELISDHIAVGIRVDVDGQQVLVATAHGGAADVEAHHIRPGIVGTEQHGVDGVVPFLQIIEEDRFAVVQIGQVVRRGIVHLTLGVGDEP